jgi:hypothetical protein
MLTVADELEIARIPVHFARGVDTLAGSPNTDAALACLRKGFTEDCRFEYLQPNGAMFTERTGLVDFTGFGHSFMHDKQYRRTQHLVSNLLIEEVDAERVTVESSVVARHVLADNSQDIALATFTDEVTRVGGRWLCRHRECRLLAFANFAPVYSLA